MNILTIVLIAFGLSLDAFAVSVASGIVVRRERVRHALKIAFFFGGFQSVMPTIGWLAGLGLKSFISGIDHWLAFGLLAFIGGKMIYEST
ncbi:MAG: manganese efflux pump, partial [Candidatus Aureabacteria bacterium]|nr:manganese efflux pump [Candidatus Auribacterota bacterium]